LELIRQLHEKYLCHDSGDSGKAESGSHSTDERLDSISPELRRRKHAKHSSPTVAPTTDPTRHLAAMSAVVLTISPTEAPKSALPREMSGTVDSIRAASW
jgi:hypothetical protein